MSKKLTPEHVKKKFFPKKYERDRLAKMTPEEKGVYIVDKAIQKLANIDKAWQGNDGECPKGGKVVCRSCAYKLDKGLWEDCPVLENVVE